MGFHHEEREGREAGFGMIEDVEVDVEVGR